MKTRISFYNWRAYCVLDNKVKEGIGFGGAELNLMNLAIELASNSELDVTFYTGDYGPDMLRYYKGVVIKRMRYFNYKKYNHPIFIILRFILLYYNIFIDKSTHYVVSTAGELIGHLGIVSHVKRKMFIFNRLAHDTDSDFDYIKMNYSKRFNKLYRFGLERVSGVIVQNQYQKDNMEKLLPQKRIIMIKNAFTDNSIPPSNSYKKTVLWVGRCSSFKQPHLFLDLVEHFHEYSFVMILPVNPGQRDNELKEKITRRAEMCDNLILLDYVPLNEIMKYFYDALLFVNTSESEGFPNTFIQASMAKTPILSLNSNPDNILDSWDMGYCCNNDYQKAVSFITEISAERLSTMGNNAYRYYKENHDIKKSAQLYKQLLLDFK